MEGLPQDGYAVRDLGEAEDAQAALDRLLEAAEAAVVAQVQVPALDPTELLDGSARPFFSFAAPGEARPTVGLGEAARVDAPGFNALKGAGERLGGARALLTARFDPEAEPGEGWTAFGAIRLLVPRLLVSPSERRTTLTLAGVPTDAEVDVLRACLGGQRPARGALPAAYSKDEPDVEGYAASVRAALTEIAEGTYTKCVLARRHTTIFADSAGDTCLIEALFADSENTWRFVVRTREGPSFFGASPEKLFARDGRTVTSEAVAGTRPRGLSDLEDERLEDELIGSEKELYEHRLVREHIHASLEPLCVETPELEGPTLRQLPTVQHLVTQIRGTLSDGVEDASLLAALHPTPAVCGTPTDVALEALRYYERFDRGLYGGVVGLMGMDEGTYCVALRSALLDDELLHMYAGAGIVEGSDPQAEWTETAHKLLPLLRALEHCRAD